MNHSLALDRPLRTSLAVDRQGEGGVIAHRTDAPIKVALNPTAFALWELCDGNTSVGEMVRAVCALFEITPEQAERDVERAIGEMRTVGLVR